MLRNIPSAMLRKLVTLSERKEALLARVQEIDQEMLRIQSRFESGNLRPTYVHDNDVQAHGLKNASATS